MRSAIRAMSGSELLEIARGFLDGDGDGMTARTRVHMRDGLLCATDGRIHLHVESPAAKAADAPGSEDRILDFAPEPAVRVAGPEWVFGELAEAVEAACRRDMAWLEEERASFERRAEEVDTQRCPHCGGFVVVEDGELSIPEEWREVNEPDERSCSSNATLRFPGRPLLERKVPVRYLRTAIDAARKLGADGELLVGETFHVVLRGEDWRIIVAAFRCDMPAGDRDIEIEAPADAGNNERGAAPNPQEVTHG